METFHVHFKNEEMTHFDAKNFKIQYGGNAGGKITFYREDDSEAKIFIVFSEIAAIVPAGTGNTGFNVRLKGKSHPILIRANNYKVDLGEYLIFLDDADKPLPNIYVAFSEVVAVVPVP